MTTTRDDDVLARQHNFLANLAGCIRARYARVQSASRETLEDLRSIGEMLLDAREALKGAGRGAFGRWCDEAQLPFDRAWRARLMKLAAHWDDILAAILALPESRRKWSVDGALAIWKAATNQHRQTTSDDEGESSSGGGEARNRKRRESEAERLRRELAEAREQIAQLKAQIEALQAASGHTRQGDRHKPRPPHLSAKDEALVRKLVALYLDDAATAGERAVAWEKLENIARRYSTTAQAIVDHLTVSA